MMFTLLKKAINIDRGFSAHDYLGLYKEKSVKAIGKIKAM
jgi:hypothetical protein